MTKRGLAIMGLAAALVGVAPPAAAVQTAAGLTSANPVPVFTQEFVSDGLGGRPWNAYNLSAASSGSPIVGTPHAVTGANGQVSIFGRAPNGDLLQFVNDGLGGRLWNSYDLSADLGSGPISGSAAPIFTGVLSVFARGANGDLLEFVQNFASGRAWNIDDLSQSAPGGGEVGGDPNVVFAQNNFEVFAQGSNGDLVEYQGPPGGPWKAEDLSALAAGAPITGIPSPVFYSVSNTLHVYVRVESGDLVEYAQDGAFGRPWNAYDLSTATGAGGLESDPDVLFVPSLGLMHVYVQNANGDLLEYINDGAFGRLWNAYDLSVDAGGGTFVAGNPDALYLSSTNTIHVYVRKANNDLVEFVSDGVGGHIWNAYDLTQAAFGPSIGTDPSALQIGQFVHVYVGGPTPMGGVVISNLFQVPNAPYASGARVVALSFDDGPSSFTTQILGILMRYRAPASFELVGARASGNVGLLATEDADGFGVVNHTWDHVDLTKLAPSGWAGEVDATDNLLKAVLHREPDCLRPPYGYTNNSVVAQLASRGLGEFMWDIDPSDYLRPGVSTIVQRVLGALHPGAVILLHDGGGDRAQTVAALPAIITGIRTAGYSIVEACG